MERKLKDADNDSLRWLYDSTRIFVPIFSGANFHQIFQEDGNRKVRLLVSELFHGLWGKFNWSIWLWAQLHKTQHRDKTDLCIEKRKLSDFGQIIFLPNATTIFIKNPKIFICQEWPRSFDKFGAFYLVMQVGLYVGGSKRVFLDRSYTTFY